MKLSVVTVSLNNADTVGDTLASVQAQTYPDVEHVCVDGVSTDGTQEILRDNEDAIGRLIVEPDTGLYDAMNKGVAAASGDIIGILNADDVYAADDVLAEVADVFARDPTVDAVYGDLVYVDRGDLGRVVRTWRSRPMWPGLVNLGWYPPHPTFFVRRDVYERFGDFDLSYKLAADVELMIRFLGKHKITARYLPKLIVRMRMGGTSNRDVRTVVEQNAWIYRAFHKNRVLYHPAFPLLKLPGRILQYHRARRERHG